MASDSSLLPGGGTPSRSDSVELLAPAGNLTCMKAAVENGADAVYFGLETFNARARADNFRREDLPGVMAWLRRRGVRGYVTMNTLVFSDELDEACETLRAASEAGVDAVLVQDLGIARLASELVPDLPVHASTQMTITSPRAMEMLETWGIRRFVLPREFSVDDISTVHQASPAEIEVFVHGALCVAYSGQCLTSEALGGRSANRGECAQACRQPYDMLVDGRRIDLGNRRYLLSPQDLAGAGLIPHLLDAGVVSFKIEGRLKTPEYVANITRHYRSAIDAALGGKGEPLRPEAWAEMQQSFSRGFSTGFLEGVDHQRLVRGDFPKSRGLAVGEVVEVRPGSIFVSTGESTGEGIVAATAVKPGDGIVFDNGNPERAEPGGPVYHVTQEGNLLRFSMAHDFPYTRVRPGDRAWKTSDPELNRRLRASWTSEKRTLGMHLSVRGSAGQPLEATATCGDTTVSASGTEALRKAERSPLSEPIVADKLGALGNTGYHLASLDVSLDDDLMAPVSSLKRLRRALVEAMDHALARAPKRRYDATAPARLRKTEVPVGARPASRELTVLCRSVEQVAAACEAGVQRIYIDFEDPRGFRESVGYGRKSGIPVYLATPRIEKPREEGFFRKIAAYEPDGVLVRNLGALLYFKERHGEWPLVGDFSLNCANDLTGRTLLAMGLERIVPSYDLNAQQLESMLAALPSAPWEVVLHQYMPMFHMEHCVFAAILSEGHDYRDCGRPCERHDVALQGPANTRFPVKADVGCRNTVFNGHAQSGALYLRRFLALDVAAFRVELLREDAGRTRELLAIYRKLVDGVVEPERVWSQLKAAQRLGVTRGTLDR